MKSMRWQWSSGTSSAHSLGCLNAPAIRGLVMEGARCSHTTHEHDKGDAIALLLMLESSCQRLGAPPRSLAVLSKLGHPSAWRLRNVDSTRKARLHQPQH